MSLFWLYKNYGDFEMPYARSFSVPVNMVRDSVKYKDLSDQDKQELEDKLGLTEFSNEELQEFKIGSQ